MRCRCAPQLRGFNKNYLPAEYGALTLHYKSHNAGQGACQSASCEPDMHEWAADTLYPNGKAAKGAAHTHVTCILSSIKHRTFICVRQHVGCPGSGC
ncbi:hypothetical protein FKM82_014268 [Ascaphus truei]